MNKTISFSGGGGTKKPCKNVAHKAQKPGLNQPVSINRSAVAMTFSEPASSLAVAIAVLYGCLMSAMPAHAGFNIPTATVDPVTGLFTPVPSPMYFPTQTATGQPTISADGLPNNLCPNANRADPFTAKLALFEEFGLKDMSDSSTSSASTLPVPTDCNGVPDGPALDHFLKEDLHSVPSRKSDETDAGTLISEPNPWEAKVKDCLGLAADMAMPADGRPAGEWFAHQRWDEFYTKAPRLAYFQTAMTGARVNGGLRDKKQLHEYKVGEFGPGGLYYLGLPT